MRFPCRRCFLAPLLLALSLQAIPAGAQDSADADEADLRQRAADGLLRAAMFLHGEVSTRGGYLWRYSEDLKKREGEGRADNYTVWVQPPGTPAVGMTMLLAYRATGDPCYLVVAKDAADCLLEGQMRSGGWAANICFDPKARLGYDYRLDPESSSTSVRRYTVLDDNMTQSALWFLADLDKTLEFKDRRIHKAARYGLRSLVQAQMPGGGWPQVYPEFGATYDPKDYPIKRAEYIPKDTEPTRVKEYWRHYTLNDNVMSDVIALLLRAERIYNDPEYGQAARRGGDFLLAAQMPQPQPGWAQQYDSRMRPAWARKFEPPAISGGESQRALLTLIHLYIATGDRKYLQPHRAAIDYFRVSLLEDGRLARFYELRTNRPLYFTKDYELTYSDADMPTHYAFKIESKLDAIEQWYAQVAAMTEPERLAAREAMLGDGPRPPASPGEVERVLAALDDQGRWVEDQPLKYFGADDPTKRTISCATFNKNADTLIRFLATGDTPEDR